MYDYEIDSFYERYFYRNLYPAVKKTLVKGTQYSCALLLFSYSEMVGSHITGNCNKRNKGRTNYEKFLEYMGESYCELFKKFPNVNFYDRLRNGLAHEIEPKGQHGVWLTEKPSENRNGIEYVDDADLVNVHLQEYFRDFKIGMDKLYQELKTGKNIEVLSNFINCRRQNYDRYITEEKGVKRVRNR